VCAHPAVGAPDLTQRAVTGDGYATRHDPFVYFHSIIDNTGLCDRHVVNLDALPADLSRVSSTRNYTFITLNLCNDGMTPPAQTASPAGCRRPMPS
jgi:hypothetical protein